MPNNPKGLAFEQLSEAVEKAEALMKKEEGLTVAQAAERLGVSVATIYDRRKRARRAAAGLTGTPWKRKKTKGKTPPSYRAIAVPAAATADFELRGSPESIARFITAMGKGGDSGND